MPFAGSCAKQTPRCQRGTPALHSLSPLLSCRGALCLLNLRRVKKTVRPEIARKTIYRLSLYLRCLQRLKSNAIRTVSSEALAKAAGVKPTQLRKDLTYFGQFGTRGLGYNVEALGRRLTEALGTTQLQPVILVGAGHLGSALLRYHGFAKEGFEVVAAFDLRVS